MCAQHDIRLQPVYINTKDNLLADLLSRLDMPRFLVEHKAFLRADIWRQDRDDWMVCPVRWAALDQEFGPFTVDACVAESRANAYCYLSWSAVEDARVQKFDGHNAWGEPAFQHHVRHPEELPEVQAAAAVGDIGMLSGARVGWRCGLGAREEPPPCVHSRAGVGAGHSFVHGPRPSWSWQDCLGAHQVACGGGEGGAGARGPP